MFFQGKVSSSGINSKISYKSNFLITPVVCLRGAHKSITLHKYSIRTKNDNKQYTNELQEIKIYNIVCGADEFTDSIQAIHIGVKEYLFKSRCYQRTSLYIN